MGPLGSVLLQHGSDVPVEDVNGCGDRVLSMSKQDCKVFVGGLSWETSDEKLRCGAPFRADVSRLPAVSARPGVGDGAGRLCFAVWGWQLVILGKDPR